MLFFLLLVFSVLYMKQKHSQSPFPFFMWLHIDVKSTGEKKPRIIWRFNYGCGNMNTMNVSLVLGLAVFQNVLDEWFSTFLVPCICQIQWGLIWPHRCGCRGQQPRPDPAMWWKGSWASPNLAFWGRGLWPGEGFQASVSCTPRAAMPLCSCWSW